jgi:PKD repeat protein
VLTRRITLALTATVTGAMFAVAGVQAASAGAATAAPGYAVSDWATGFATTNPSGGVGPIGLAVSGSQIYVGDDPAGRLYRFDQDLGGLAGPATEVTTAPVPGTLAGLAFDKDGRLYAALQSAGSVVELSTTDGHVLRTVAGGLPCATGLATDPLSGDLFVTQPCGIAGVTRLTGFANGPATASRYTTTGGEAIDGLVFGPDGTLYASSPGHVYRVAGTDQPDAGAATALASVIGGDGLAVAASTDPTQPPFLLANLNNGSIRKIDLTTTPATVSDVVTGGTRGDFATVGTDGCLYATQSATVLKVTLADGTCNLAPAVPNQPPTAAFTWSPSPGRATHPVAFDGTTSTDPDGTIVDYAWDFGDGSIGSGATPSHAYAAPGTYTVTLTVKDDDGATSSVSHQVTVLAQRLGTFSCSATAARVLGLAVASANPADSPCRADSAQLAGIGLAPVSIHLLRASTLQTPADLAGTDPSATDQASADTTIADATINLGLTTIKVTGLVSHAQVACDGAGHAVFTGSSQLGTLTINGVARPVGTAPLDLDLLVGSLHLNSTVRSGSQLVQRALWLHTAVGDVVLGETRADTSGTPCA